MGSSNAELIHQAVRVVKPGVGSAPHAMKMLRQKRLGSVLKVLKQPVLGICLGMQLLYETLEEGGLHVEGLGVLKGKVTLLNTETSPSPHMGWNKLSFNKSDGLLNGIREGSYVYFVHSFAAAISNYSFASTRCATGFSSIVKKNNFYGGHFHPERISNVIANILENLMTFQTLVSERHI